MTLSLVLAMVRYGTVSTIVICGSVPTMVRYIIVSTMIIYCSVSTMLDMVLHVKQITLKVLTHNYI